MRLTATQTRHYARVLHAAWAGDESLLSTHHAIAPCDLAAAVRDSAKVLASDKLAKDFAFYKLSLGTETVGFVGVEPGNNCLITFGLAVAHRTDEAKGELWRWIRQLTNPDKPILCILHSHNERAQRFLEGGGGKLIQHVTHEGRHGALFIL